jgi:tetratricopeptide (TPR) repeat protein
VTSGVDRLTDRAAAWYDAGLDHVDAGDSRKARRAFRQALRIFEANCGRRHPDVANVLIAIAGVERSLGNLAIAERTGRRAMAIMNPLRAGGDIARLRVQSHAGLAETLIALGRYAEARRLLRRALACAERRLGADDVDTAAALNALGMIGKYTGRFAEASGAYRRAYRILARNSGVDADLASLYHNLGGLEHARGRFARAEPYARRALEMRRRSLAAGHPLVASEMAALAPIVSARGRHDEAAGLLLNALTIFRRVYGPRCYDVAAAYHNLAASRAASGRHPEAERLYRRALDIKERLFGHRHPDTVLTARALAATRERRAVSGSAGFFRT